MLSFTNGQTNIWQTLILPLVHNSSSLYHAISAMTALHISNGRFNLELYARGLELMQRSLYDLRIEVCGQAFKTTTLATTLILAVWTRWNEELGNGNSHLRGAFSMFTDVWSHFNKHGVGSISTTEAESLAFLMSTCFSIDALTSLVDSVKAKDDYQSPSTFDSSIDSDFNLSWFLCSQTIVNLDPWTHYSWGIGRFMKPVASISYEVKMATGVSSSMITKAAVLKRQIYEWSNDAILDLLGFEEGLLPMDAQYMVHTAEGYRYGTLLFLHQAVPEAFDNNIQQLAIDTITHLASCPALSTMTFAQIYPLFIAGCEVTGVEEREWVKERWAAMIARMRITNVSRCWEITQEMWRRRDAHCQWKSDNVIIMQSMDQVVGPARDMDPEFSIKGRLHWAQVLKDWNWEVSF